MTDKEKLDTLAADLCADMKRRQSLASLLKAFEAALSKFMSMPTIMGKKVSDEGWEADELTPDYWASSNWWRAAFVRDAARRYIIARDFNEFDPGKADMLWKLKYGGM